MNHIPPEDLVVIAQQTDRDFHQKVQHPAFNEQHAPDWRNFIPPDVRKIWDRMGYSLRLAAFVVAASCAKERERRIAARGER